MQSVVAPASTEKSSRSSDRAVAAWLLVCCALVFAMVVVGGITRLTHSGLSIVEWQPVAGALPPLDDAQWEEVFGKYRQTPEFRQVNPDMGLPEFKRIFWWEYFHRLLGRLIGAAFLLPLVWFALRGRIARPLMPKLAGIFVLGGLQGAMGWYMVESGLVADPRVSQLRLAAHLGFAFLIYGAMLWIALDLLLHRAETPAMRGSLRAHAGVFAALVFAMVLSGALVAGTHAGLEYNTFPLMNGGVLPPDGLGMDPWYRNLYDNLATVQFDHRLIAWLLAFLVAWLWLRMRRSDASGRARLAAHLLLAAVALQITLGISTLLLFVPVPLAAAHQAGAVLVFTAALFLLHSLRG